jgi:benzoate membrane transport protein
MTDRASFVQPVTAGILAAVVGFASAFAVVLEGLAGAGATPAQAASGLLALCVAQGLLSIVLSLRWRQPINIVWSTPGAALLVGAGLPHGGFGIAVTAFLLIGALILAAGLCRPLARAVAAIPLSLASAMLAGVLMELCLAPVQAVAHLPALALPIVIAWALGWSFARRYAVPIAVLVATLIVVSTTRIPAAAMSLAWAHPQLITPGLDLVRAAGIAIPMFIVTMASQNVPGLAVLRGNGYDVPIGKVFVTTGLGTFLVALFGGHALNLSAITAALCAGPEADADPARRYIASVAAGVCYIALGLCAGFAAVLIAASPPLIIQAVAGLALLGSLAAALGGALADENHRLAAITTFVTTASGISIGGIAGAFWGLIAGGLMLLLDRAQRRWGAVPRTQTAPPEPGRYTPKR